LGYNRSTFYQYFSDIYELLDFVENNLLNYIKEELANKELSMHTVQNALIPFFISSLAPATKGFIARRIFQVSGQPVYKGDYALF
jgi:AcrR family transcriptional regulator